MRKRYQFQKMILFFFISVLLYSTFTSDDAIGTNKSHGMSQLTSNIQDSTLSQSEQEPYKQINHQPEVAYNQPLAVNDLVTSSVYSPQDVQKNKIIDSGLPLRQDEPKSGIELTQKRTRNSKTYLNKDGTTTVQTATYSLHYLDGAEWKDIDTTIREDHTDSSYSHSMLTNNFKVRLQNKAAKHAVSFSKYDQSVTYRAIGINNVLGVVYGNLIDYHDAWQSTDLQYQVQNDQLKMEIRLADDNAPKMFSFEIETKDEKHRVNADGSIDFVDKDGKIQFKIPQLWVQDATSNTRLYDKLKVDVIQKGNKTVIEMTLDDNGLQYPILIDPTTQAIFSQSNDSYQASTGFSSVQGQNNWYYQEWDGSQYRNMTYDSASGVWKGSNEWTIIANNWQHPSNESVRTWAAPRTGLIRISGNVAKGNPGGGDGVRVKVMKNSTQLYPGTGWQTIAYNDTRGADIDITINVVTGDRIYFYVNQNNAKDYDSTNWDPVITYYDSYVGSAGFSSGQGKNNWYYQEWDGSQYRNMTWDSVSGVWKGSNEWTIIGNNWQHPSNTESVRTWAAPRTGFIRISGNVAKGNPGGGDGVRVKVMKNSTQLYPGTGWQTIAYNDTRGADIDITINVVTGDRIYFYVDQNNIKDFDSTNWDPVITYYDSYVGSAGFSSVQGQNNWYFQEWDGSQYRNMTWDSVSGVWKGSNEWTIIGNNWQHPSNTESVRTWAAPRTGFIRISGNVAKGNPGGGDGVRVKVMKNSTQLYPGTGWQTIAYNDTRGANIDITLSVVTGDRIYFNVDQNNAKDFDSTNWDPVITYILPTWYTYDNSGRLDYFVKPSGQVIDYNYDQNGNLLNKIKR